MASSTIFGGLLTRRACPTKCFGYGEVVDVYLQAKRDGVAAKRFFKRLLRSHLVGIWLDAEHYRHLSVGAFTEWDKVVA